MPKLAKFAVANEDLRDRVLVVGVHEPGPKSVAEVLAEVERMTADLKAKVKEVESQGGHVSGVDFGVLPVIVIDDASGGAWSQFAPETLGDMVLVDPHGVVAAAGEDSFTKLQSIASDLRRGVSDASAQLASAKTAAQIEDALGALDGLGLALADKAAAEFVAACPPKLVPAALEVAARRGQTDAVVASLSDADAKRRRSAIDATAKAPSPAWVAPLLAVVVRPKVPLDEACAALRAAVACGPTDAAVVAKVIELAKKSEYALRTCAIELLGRVDSSLAKPQLLALLEKDVWRGARSAAALALAQVGGDDVTKALERASTEDKIDTVRAAAKQALALLEKKAAPKGG